MTLDSLKFVIAPMGSAGDVHPLLWLARLLQRRGHEVIFIVQAAAEELAKRSGVPYITVGNLDEQNAVIKHPHLWHPRKGIELISRYMPAYAREMLPTLQAQIDPGRTVMLAGSLAFAARVAAEIDDIPLLSVHLQPSLMMSVEDSPVMAAGMEWMPKAPKWVRRAIFDLAHWKVDRMFRKPIGKMRREMGVTSPFPKGIFRDWWHSPDGVICLFPEWYAPKARDWPRQAVLTRFPLYDEAEVMEDDPKAERFLDGGEPPVVITPGSANAQASRFLREAALACKQSGRRAMILTRYPEQLPEGLPETIKAFEYLPFGRVFPRASAVIHHGGVGTTAQCLAAGVPQVIMPMSHDQPDNAARIKRFGVGDYLYPKAFKAPAIAAKLKTLTKSAEVKFACHEYRKRMDQQMSERHVGDLLESLGERALRVRQINGVGVPA